MLETDTIGLDLRWIPLDKGTLIALSVGMKDLYDRAHILWGDRNFRQTTEIVDNRFSVVLKRAHARER